MALKVCFVSDLGGHTTEALQLIDAFEGCSKFFIVPHKDVDRSMAMDLPNVYMIREKKCVIPIPTVPLIKLFRLLIKEKPDVIISTGSVIAIPTFLFGKILRAKLIFLECSAQVTSPSTTGKIVYWLADLFFVQWESLLKCYGSKARYVGGLI